MKKITAIGIGLEGKSKKIHSAGGKNDLTSESQTENIDITVEN